MISKNHPIELPKNNHCIASLKSAYISTNCWIKKIWYLCTMEFYSVVKKNETIKLEGKLELSNPDPERQPLNALCHLWIQVSNYLICVWLRVLGNARKLWRGQCLGGGFKPSGGRTVDSGNMKVRGRKYWGLKNFRRLKVWKNEGIGRQQLTKTKGIWKAIWKPPILCQFLNISLKISCFK